MVALSREGRVATLRRDLNRGIRDERQQASPISKRLLQAEGTTCAKAQRWKQHWHMLRLARKPVWLEWSVSEGRCSDER